MNFNKLYYSFPPIYHLHCLMPPVSIWRNRATAAITKELSTLKGMSGKILEIGCGPGFFSRKLAQLLHNMEIYSIDSSAAMIAYASRKHSMPNLRFFNVNYFEIPESNLRFEKFEVVIGFHTWTFFSLEASIELLRKISKRGTTFIAVTYSGTLWSKLSSWALSFFFKSPLYLHQPSQFLEILRRFGFDAEHKPVDPIEGTYLVKAVLRR